MDGVQRQLMWHYLSGRTPYVRVSEYPKSGGTWLGQIISKYLDIPFPRNRRPAISRLQPCLLHGHHVYADHVKDIVCILRDGRDVMVSAYYYLLHQNNDVNARNTILRSLPSRDHNNIVQNLPAFIEYMFTRPTLGGMRLARGKVTWSKFTESWLDTGANIVTYEAMQDNAILALTPVLERLTNREVDQTRLAEAVDQFSFKNQTKRKPGVEDRQSFLRKGISGDWKNKFSVEACDVFKHFAGETLIRADYERDLLWTSDLDQAAKVSRPVDTTRRAVAVPG